MIRSTFRVALRGDVEANKAAGLPRPTLHRLAKVTRRLNPCSRREAVLLAASVLAEVWS